MDDISLKNFMSLNVRIETKNLLSDGIQIRLVVGKFVLVVFKFVV